MTERGSSVAGATRRGSASDPERSEGSAKEAARFGRRLMAVGLGGDEIRSLLDELNDELGRRGAHADLFLVGGAALALVYDASRSTRELDAVFLPTDIARRAAEAVAERRGLAAEWLNDAVRCFLPGPDPNARRYYDGGSLTVDVASPRYLLAMKLLASGAETDADDIAFLYRQLGYTTVEEGLDVLANVYQGRPVDAKVPNLLAEVVDAVADERPAGRETPCEAGALLAEARWHGMQAEAARQQMLASARARRVAILEAHCAGMSIRRVAAELGCSPAVVQDAVRQARAEARDEATGASRVVGDPAPARLRAIGHTSVNGLTGA